MLFNKRKNNLTDEELVQKYKDEGKQKWLGLLWDRHVHLVFGVCLKYLKNEVRAQDETINIFEKLMTDLKEKEVKQFKPWLYVVCRNHCLMYLRKNKHWKDRKQDDEILNRLADEGEDYQIKEDLLNRLEGALENLNDEQQVCVKLFYIEGRSYQEVSDLTGYELNKVKSYIQNGKRNLKNQLSS